VAPIVNHNLECDENWNTETVEDAEPFIFGTNFDWKKSPSRQRHPRSEPAMLEEYDLGAAPQVPVSPKTQPVNATPSAANATFTALSHPALRATEVLPSTMKQVGLGHGCVRPPVTNNRQLAISGSRFATASSAFNVDALVGRPNITNGGPICADVPGSELSFRHLQSTASVSQSQTAHASSRPVTSVSNGDSLPDITVQPVSDRKKDERKLRKKLRDCETDGGS